jgi:hypothetical protein
LVALVSGILAGKGLEAFEGDRSAADKSKDVKRTTVVGFPVELGKRANRRMMHRLSG